MPIGTFKRAQRLTCVLGRLSELAQQSVELLVGDGLPCTGHHLDEHHDVTLERVPHASRP